MASTVTRKGQVTIPKKIREYLEIDTNDQVEFVLREGAVVLEPVTRSVADFRGFLKGAQAPADAKSVRAAVKARVAERAARREKPADRRR
jgi:AbrB family looped-hinge helix DNA binding protein